MINMFKREIIYIWYYFASQFGQIFWYWVIGMAIGSLVSVFAKDRIQDRFARMNSSRLGLFGIVPASLLGIVNPLGIYGSLPAAAALAGKGMRQDWLAAFLLGSALLNPQLIVYSAALGPKGLAVRVVTCVLCACAAGLLVYFCGTGEPFFAFSGFEPAGSQGSRNNRKNQESQKNPNSREENLLPCFLKDFGHNARATAPYFIKGILVAALFRLYVPHRYIVAFFGAERAGGVLGVLLAAAIGLLIYSCGIGTVPVVRTWLLQGMSIGSAAAFMITCAAVKLTKHEERKVLSGGRKSNLYILFIFVFAFAAGIVTNLLFW